MKVPFQVFLVEKIDKFPSMRKKRYLFYQFYISLTNEISLVKLIFHFKLIYHFNKITCHHFFVENIDKLIYASFTIKKEISFL